MGAWLSKDLVVDEEKFNQAAENMRTLKQRTETLRQKLDTMYDELIKAMDTSAGKELQIEAKSVLLKPVENMALVVEHISNTLNMIIGSGYYKDVFTGFEELSHLF